MKIALIGPPASGKGTQAELLAQKFKIPLISSGNLFRWHIKNKTELGRKVEPVINQGKLVSDSLTNQIIKEEIDKTKNSFILDGYPRTIHQAIFLDSITNLDYILEIWISDQEVLNRLTLRRVCQCGKTYHLVYNPPKNEGVCDECERTLFIREDDEKEKILKRLEIYHQESEPLIDFYQKRGILVKINGEQPIQNVFQEILRKLKVKN
ncbi:MAG: nucleoside monophosphate kinase [Patescibacteria group bacterium]|nr:nucleoside monophosphate kinase [Patescibacteria group bacterium]